jgi:hypothetical protein
MRPRSIMVLRSGTSGTQGGLLCIVLAAIKRQYLFISTRNFHYCENYEPQKTVFFFDRSY